MARTPKKVVISAAITGAIHTPSMSPYFAATPDQIIQQAVDAHKTGAAIVHIHARNDEGMPVGDFATFEKILTGIKSQRTGHLQRRPGHQDQGHSREPGL